MDNILKEFRDERTEFTISSPECLKYARDYLVSSNPEDCGEKLRVFYLSTKFLPIAYRDFDITIGAITEKAIKDQILRESVQESSADIAIVVDRKINLKEVQELKKIMDIFGGKSNSRVGISLIDIAVDLESVAERNWYFQQSMLDQEERPEIPLPSKKFRLDFADLETFVNTRYPDVCPRELKESIIYDGISKNYEFLSPVDQNVLTHQLVELSKEKQEILLTVALKEGQIAGISDTFVGGLDQSVAHPREIFKFLIEKDADGFLVAHNHPSGDSEPSPNDVQISDRLRKVGQQFGISFVDHVVVGDGEMRVNLAERLALSQVYEKGVQFEPQSQEMKLEKRKAQLRNLVGLER